MVLDTLIIVGNIATYFFVWSYKTGKFIVSVLCFIARSLYISTEKLSYLLRILVGDFEVFLQDVSRTFNNIVSTVGDTYNYCSGVVDHLTKFCIEYFLFIRHGIRNFFANVYFSLEETVILINNFVRLIGPALWFLGTLPNNVFQLVVHCIHHIKSYIFELYVNAHKFFLKICSSSVPAEIYTGLIFILILVYLVVRFRKLIANICRKSVLFVFFWLNLNIIKFPLNILRLAFVKSNPTRKEISQDKDETHLCIICQTNPRSIVLLPCRHLCLCDKCSYELVRYQTNNCPICRQQTNLKLKVYI